MTACAQSPALTAAEVEHAVLEAMAEHGIVPKHRRDVIADGTLHRFHCEGDRAGTLNGYCTIYLDGKPAASFGCWRRDVKATWAADRSMIPVHLSTPRPAPKPKHVGKREYAQKLWASAQDQAEPCANVHRLDRTVAGHPYCRKKRITNAFGAARIRERGRDLLIVPIKVDGVGEVISVQTIAPWGFKLTYGAMDDAYLLLGDERDTTNIWVCVEGWATAWAVSGSLHRLRRPAPVLVAFGSGRLECVAAAARAKYSARVKVLEEGALWT